MKHASLWLSGAALGTAFALVAPDASAQGVLSGNSRRMGATLNLGGSIGIAGAAGVSAFRLNPEFHYSFGEGMRGPAIGVGLDMYIPGFGIGASARFQYNIQPIDGVAFLITPYGGLTVGGYFTPIGAGFMLPFHFGAELRLIIADRGFLTFRPLGFSVPLIIGDAGVVAYFAYDIAFGGGLTF